MWKLVLSSGKEPHGLQEGLDERMPFSAQFLIFPVELRVVFAYFNGFPAARVVNLVLATAVVGGGAHLPRGHYTFLRNPESLA